jgi:hypothetical protein
MNASTTLVKTGAMYQLREHLIGNVILTLLYLSAMEKTIRRYCKKASTVVAWKEFIFHCGRDRPAVVWVSEMAPNSAGYQDGF